MSVGNFAPKGGMCVSCVHSKRKCDDLPFHKMKVIDICKVSNFKFVKCDDYKPSK